MTSTAHALVGAAIAAHFRTPEAALPLALTSHFVLDSIPHWDFGTDWRSRPKHATGLYAIAETLFGITLAFFLFRTYADPLILFLAISASLLPDWLEIPWYVLFAHQSKRTLSPRAGLLEKTSYAFYKIPNRFHAKADFVTGIATQVVTVGFFLYLLLK